METRREIKPEVFSIIFFFLLRNFDIYQGEIG